MKVVSKQEALRLGLSRYFTGKPCKHGHTAERLIKSHGQCVACRDLFLAKRHAALKDDDSYRARRRAATKAWKGRHPEYVAASNRRQRTKDLQSHHARVMAWQKAHPEKVAEYARNKRKKNPEANRAAVKRWAEKNPDHAIARAQMRRARIKANGGSVSAAELAKLRKLQKGRCAACGRGGKMHIDHIIPLIRGGKHEAHNLQFLCVPCNLSKAARDPIEWQQSNGRLL